MREDSIEREPFCQRVMASLFGTVSRGTELTSAVYSCSWVGKGCARAARSGKSDSARRINTDQTRNAARLQTHPNPICSDKMQGERHKER